MPGNPLGSRVTSYTVTQLRSDLADYGQLLTLTTEFGYQITIVFSPQPPADWLVVSTATSPETVTVYLDAGQFDRTLHLLQSEAQVFAVSLSLFGIRVFSLSTANELPGEGAGSPAVLREFMARVRQEEPHPGASAS